MASAGAGVQVAVLLAYVGWIDGTQLHTPAVLIRVQHCLQLAHGAAV